MAPSAAPVAPVAPAAPAAPIAPAKGAAKVADVPVAVEAVIVTARHRAERAQSVPVAITSVSRAELAPGAIDSVAKLPQLVPSLQVTDFNPRNTSFNIRGIGNQVALANDGLEDGVGVYVDGVFQSRPAQATFALPDITGIDVLRGPQGTLFGKNTTAGAVDIHTRAPSFTPAAELDTSIGSYGYTDVNGFASGPLGAGSRIAGSIAFLDENRDGFITNVVSRAHYQGEHQRAVRAQILSAPADNLTVRVIADYSHQSATCCVSLPVVAIGTLEGGAMLPGALSERTAGTGYRIPSFGVFNRNTDVNSPVHYDTETGGVSATEDLTFGGGYALTSISAWRFWNFAPHNDLDDLGLDIQAANNQTDHQRQASQEFRLTSPAHRIVTWSAGLYYFYQDIPGNLRIAYGRDAGSYLVEPILGAAGAASSGGPALNGYTLSSATDVRTNSEAAYGQATAHLAPAIELTGGLRGTLEQKTGSFDQTAFGGDANVPLGGLIQGAVRQANSAVDDYTARADDAILSGLATLSWKPADGTLVYATYDRGEKTSGINNDGVPAGVGAVIRPERVDDYEVGIKQSLLQERLTLDGAAYWIEDTDYQAEIANLTGNNLLTYLANVPKVRSRGLELDARYRPTVATQIFVSGAYDDAIYESFRNGPCPIEIGGGGTCDLSGRPLPGTSRLALTVGGSYAHPVGRVMNRDLVAYVSGDVSLRSSFHTTPDDSAYSTVPGYEVTDLSLGLRPEKGRWDVSLFVRNAFDTKYYRYLAVATPNAGLVVGAPGDPITFGATLRVKL